MEALVILGTGTEIGKTYVSCRIAAAWPDCCALKPVETGFTSNTQAPDASALSEAANHPYRAPRYGFPRPVSPHLEARRLSSPIDLEQLTEWVEETRAALGRERLLIETAGGAFSPLHGEPQQTPCFNADLAARLKDSTGCQVALVAADRLGALHEVIATQRALAAHSTAADFIVLSQAHVAGGGGESSNAEELRILQDRPVFVQAYAAPSPPTLLEYLTRAFHG
ncbi:MAG: dethiobiotin synthase [Myxococcales bacterium]|nr:dethiobiotin synthase [Myxococcales bacterium]